MILTTSSTQEVASLKSKRLKAKYRTCYSSAKLLTFLTTPNYHFLEDDWEELKGDHTTTTAVRVNRNLLKSCPIVAKRYNKKNTWHGLRRTVRRSRAENCWNHAINLEGLGIKTAPPVAFIQEYSAFGLKNCSWYLYEFVDGSSCIEKLQYKNEGNDEKVMEEFVATLSSLWKQHISHGDTKGTNFLLAQGQVVVIDLDGMKQHKNGKNARRLIRKDIKRFLRNWQNSPHLLELARAKLKLFGFD